MSSIGDEMSISSHTVNHRWTSHSSQKPSPEGITLQNLTERRRQPDGVEVDALLDNPLAGLRNDDLRSLGRQFVKDYLKNQNLIPTFENAAILAQDHDAWKENTNSLDLTNDELRFLIGEEKTPWKQPKRLYSMVILCSLSAAVHGWDETAVNGANIFYRQALELENDWLFGLVNAAPYICCAVLGCWLTFPLNELLGRRGTIFFACLVSSMACLGQGLSQTWVQLLVCRFLLGLGMGPKSATVPIFAAESAPARIRGSLVMMWQMWTAFGIMLGLMFGAIFYSVDGTDQYECQAEHNPPPEHLRSLHCSLNWRLMIASPMVLPLIVCGSVYFCPESPRWYMKKGPRYYQNAFESLCAFRNSELQAARDIFKIHCLLAAEKKIQSNRARFIELFTVPRNRRAMQAAVGLMFLQQLCGVNILVYYSTEIACRAINDYRKALLVSMGFGIINFLFALPAVKTIDTFGRRNLLLITFPLMAVFMLLTGLAFLTPNYVQYRLVILGIYLFGLVYSPGEGPVPFTYSAECFPLYVRDIGMSLATSVTWFWNAVLALTWPALETRNHSSSSQDRFSCTGPEYTFGSYETSALGIYAAFNIAGFFFILLFVPETKGRTLEELNRVFGVKTREHAAYGIKELLWAFERYVLRRNVRKPVLSCDKDVAESAIDDIEDIPMRAFPRISEEVKDETQHE